MRSLPLLVRVAGFAVDKRNHSSRTCRSRVEDAARNPGYCFIYRWGPAGVRPWEL